MNDATSLSVTGLKWFKIAEEGYDKATNTWAVDRLIANEGYWDIKIPNCIAPGQYLLRHELLALHSAASYPGAQFYVSNSDKTLQMKCLKRYAPLPIDGVRSNVNQWRRKHTA